jgi:riboflavin synthase alpha subunit
MFTGLIKDLGIIKSMKKIAEGVEFEIQTKLAS